MFFTTSVTVISIMLSSMDMHIFNLWWKKGQIYVFFAIMINSSNSRHTSLNQKPVPVIF